MVGVKTLNAMSPHAYRAATKRKENIRKMRCRHVVAEARRVTINYTEVDGELLKVELNGKRMYYFSAVRRH